LFVPWVVLANTYYVDYQFGSDKNVGTSTSAPWKHHPWMQTFSGSYTHAAGDVFVFKGGSTWLWSSGDQMFPLYVKAGGSPGTSDQYVGGQTLGTPWGSGYPVFDGGQQYAGGTTTLGTSATLIYDYIYTPSNVVINGLQLQNIGDPADGSGTLIEFVGGGSSIEIKNCILNPNASQAFAYSNGTGTSNHIWIHGNQITNAGRGVIYGLLGAVTNDVQVYNNLWQGPGIAFGASHGDGLMIGCATCVAADAATPTVTNILFYNNYFYGSWAGGASAQFYSDGWTSNATIYNNVFAIENTSCLSGGCLSPAFVGFARNDTNISIYNNTFSADSNPGEGEGVNVAAIGIYNSPASAGSLVIEGNIFSGTGIDMAANPALGFSSITIDYNLHHPSSIGGYGHLIFFLGAGGYTCDSLSACQSHGAEAHGLLGDPKFVSIPNGTIGSGNWRLQATSPAIGAFPSSQAPLNTFNYDIQGVVRPQQSAWDLGAYEFLAVKPPQNLRLGTQ
jgi:hypothetical protein